MAPTISRCPSSSTPKAAIKRHPLPKISSNVANLPLYYDESEYGEVFGYIISFKMESDYQSRIELPVYENSICGSFPTINALDSKLIYIVRIISLDLWCHMTYKDYGNYGALVSISG